MLHRRGLRVAKVVVLVAAVVWASAGVWVGDGAASVMPCAEAMAGAEVGGRVALAPTFVTVSNVQVAPAESGTQEVVFDVAWPESWRGPERPTWVEADDNWDAAWVYV